MDLGSALFEMMSGGRSEEDQPATAGDSIRYLARGYDSVSAMARDLGVARSTLRGWLGGRSPRSAPAGVVETAQYEWRRASLRPERERRMRADWSTDSMTIVGTYSYEGKRRANDEHREVRIGEYLRDTGEDLVNAYLNGADAGELETIVVDAIGDGGFYHDSFEAGDWDVDRVDWL